MKIAIIITILMLATSSAMAVDRCLPTYYEENVIYEGLGGNTRMKLLEIDQASCWVRIEHIRSSSQSPFIAWWPSEKLGGLVRSESQ